MKRIIYILFLFLPLVAVAQEDTATAVATNTVSQASKALGDSAYINGDFASAINIYEAVVANDGEAADLYYNLGNAYYKSDDIAKAILNYERALLLAPADEDIRFNLELAYSKTVDKVADGYQIFFMEWLYAVINMLGMTAWAVIGVAAFILMLVALLLFFFNNKVSIRKAGFALSLIMLFVTVFANLSALHHYHYQTNRNDAVILAPSVTAKSTPDNSGTNLFVIHEGRKVTITDDSIKAWKEIKLEDGTIGWVPAASLERI